MATKSSASKSAAKAAGEVKETANKIWLAGLGALATVGDEGQKLFDTLVSRGEAMEDRGKEGVAGAKRMLGEAKQAASGAWQRLEGVIDDKVAAALNGVGVPTRDEIRSLSKRIAELTSKVEGAAAGKTARSSAKKPAKPVKRAVRTRK
jgi:poly(hydroxyalkanoate) granule-associated protein